MFRITVAMYKASLVYLCLIGLMCHNLHAQIEVGTYSYDRPIGDKYWLKTTEVVGLHATHDKVFVMEQFLVDSGPDSNLYLLHILSKKGSLDRIDTLSVSGRDLDGIFNQYTFFYGSDNYMGIMGHTLSNFGIYDSMFLIIYNSQGNLVLDKRFPTSMHCTFNLDNNGVTTVLGYGWGLSSGEIRLYDIEGNLKTFIKGFITGKTSGSVCQINNKFYGINESGWFFSMNKDGSNYRYKLADLFRPLSDAGGMPNFDLSVDSNLLVGYRYDKFDRNTDTSETAMCMVDTSGKVLWTFLGRRSIGTTFSDFTGLLDGNTLLFSGGGRFLFLNRKGEILKKKKLSLNKRDTFFYHQYQYVTEDPSDSTIWIVGHAAQAIDGDTIHKTMVVHFDKNGDPIGTEQNITVTSIAPKPKANTIGVLSIYPNPTKNVLFLDLSKFNDDEIDVSIMSIHGQAYQYKLSSSSSSIDLAAYANGIYVAKAVIDGKVYSAKFLINK